MAALEQYADDAAMGSAQEEARVGAHRPDDPRCAAKFSTPSAAAHGSRLAACADLLPNLPNLSSEDFGIQREVLGSGPTHMQNFFTALKERGLGDGLIFDETSDRELMPPPGFVTNMPSEPMDDALHRYRQLRSERPAAVEWRRLHGLERSRSSGREVVASEDEEDEEDDAQQPRPTSASSAGDDRASLLSQGAPEPRPAPARAMCVDFDELGYPPAGSAHQPRSEPTRASCPHFDERGSYPHSGGAPQLWPAPARALCVDFEELGYPPAGGAPQRQPAPTTAECMDFDQMGFLPSGVPRPQPAPTRVECMDFDQMGLLPNGRSDSASASEDEREPRGRAGVAAPEKATGVCLLPLAVRQLLQPTKPPIGGTSSDDTTWHAAAAELGQETADKTGHEAPDNTARGTPDKTAREAGERTAREATERTGHEAPDKTAREAPEKAGHESPDKTGHAAGKQCRPAYGRTLRPATAAVLGAMEIVKPGGGSGGRLPDGRGRRRSPSPEQMARHQERLGIEITVPTSPTSPTSGSGRQARPPSATILGARRVQASGVLPAVKPHPRYSVDRRPVA